MADASITGLTAATALVRADLIEVVQDVATTPVNKKATLDVLDPGKTIGQGASADVNCVAIGVDASATSVYTADGTVAIGLNASGTTRSVAIGDGAVADSDSVIIGRDASDTGKRAVAVGVDTTSGHEGVAAGNNTTATAHCVAIGTDARSDAPFESGSVAVGKSADAGGQWAIGLGSFTNASATWAVAVGQNATCAHEASVALGYDTTTTADNQVMVGPRDIEITGVVKGIVLEDRTLGTRHRVYLDDGTLSIEAA